MTCGCQSSCGCTILGDGVTASVAIGPGPGTFTVSAIMAIMGVESTDCIDLAIDELKVLRATPILADAGDEAASVQLECTENGLVGNVVVDPASTAIVSNTPDGLRVDIPPIPGGGEAQPGDLVFHGGVGIRIGAIDADGSEVLRGDYSALHDALSLYATAANRASGVDQITAIPSTRFIEPGMVVEATSFPLGTTVISVDSSTAITVSDPATNSGSDTELRVYPHGAGNGTTTFNVPDMSRRMPLGYDYTLGGEGIATTGGAETYDLVSGNLPLHDHPATVGGTASVGTAISGAGSIVGTTDPDGAHGHGPATAGRAFVEAELATITQVRVARDSGVASPNQVDIVADTNDGDADFGQKSDSNTDTEPDHTHGISIAGATVAAALSLSSGSVNVAALTVDVGDAGSLTPTPVDTMSPYMVGRWMVQT